MKEERNLKLQLELKIYFLSLILVFAYFLFEDGKGIPLSVTVAGASSHDKKLVKRTLDAII